MREIKFRGKNIKSNEWLYGYLSEMKDPILPDNFCFTINGCVVQADTIGQYTGLKDCNGKEIYEGDIIKTPLGHVGIVRFGKAEEYCTHKEWGRMITDAYTTYGWIFDGKIKVAIDDEILKGEVIGNIFDNEELLNDWSK